MVSATFVTVPAQAATVDLVLTRTSPADPITGDKVTFTGTAPASLAGATVALQRRVGKTADWVKAAATKVTTDGTYALSGVATGVGLNQWRVTATKNGSVHTSKVAKTTVYAWYYLSQLDTVDDDSFGSDSVAVGGKTYSKSVMNSYDSALANDGNIVWGEWNLSYRCKTLNTWVGVADSSESGFGADFTIYVDGAETDLGTKTLGPATATVLDVSTRLRLRLELQGTPDTQKNDLDGYGVYGNAKVLCSGKP
nr:NPCBM/NEW2 domain-containing protein [Nocardioides ginsengisegetis]